MSTKLHGVEVDFARDNILSEQARVLLQKFYCREDESSPQEAYARAAAAYSYGDSTLAQNIYEAASKGWFMFSSPILSNAPRPGESVKALPISCFLSYVCDSIPGLISHTEELRWLSVKGGGVGGHWGDVRSVSDVAPGPIPFLHTVDADMTAYRQGRTRKGSYAAYLDVSHPDLQEFMSMRVPTGAVDRKCLNIHHAVNLTDEFMVAVKENKEWNFVDPNDGTVRDTVRAREVWAELLEIRARTGEPYFNFIDTANAHLPETQRALGLTIKGSNLCNEIHLPTNEERTAVCCLASLNLEKYDEWKGTPLVRWLTRFLDNVLQFFIDHAPPELSRAVFSATRERSLGIGAMGFHYLLQRSKAPFGSQKARDINEEVFAYIKSEAVAESLLMGSERGEAPDMAGTGRRNAHLLAIAPNANSSIIAVTSPSIEAGRANAFAHRTRAGTHLIQNPYLKAALDTYGMDTEEIWSSITTSKGSVQHLNFLSEEEKEVFKTAMEIDQHHVVQLAADRQKYLCQGQSLNLFFPSGVSRKYVSSVHYQAWELKCKGLYYYRTETSNRAEDVSTKIERDRLMNFTDMETASSGVFEDPEDCVSCEG